MNITTSFTNTYKNESKPEKNTGFRGHSPDVKIADDIYRKVNREFPIASSSRLNRYKTVHRKYNTENYLNYVNSLIRKLRMHCTSGTYENKSIPKEISDMKKYKIGNCSEIADITLLALKMNGHKDAAKLDIFAYNTKTKKLRNLDHSVVGLNFNISEDIPSIKKCSIPKKLIPVYYNKKSIIVDSWGGFTLPAQEAIAKYKTNQIINTNLRKNERICFIPEELNISGKDIIYYSKKFPTLLTNKNKENLDNKISLKELFLYYVPAFSNSVRKKLRKKFNITSINNN